MSIKTRRSEVDLAFLRNCKSLNVYAKFLCFHLPSNTAWQDVLAIKKHLLKSAINRRFKEYRKLLYKRNNLMTRNSSVLNSLDSYILRKAVAHSVAKAANQFIKTREKKLRNVTRKSVLSFTSSEAVTNLSSFVPAPQSSLIRSNLVWHTQYVHHRLTRLTSSPALLNWWVKEWLEISKTARTLEN